MYLVLDWSGRWGRFEIPKLLLTLQEGEYDGSGKGRGLQFHVHLSGPQYRDRASRAVYHLRGGE